MVQSRAGAPELPLDAEGPTGGGMELQFYPTAWVAVGLSEEHILGRLEGTGDPAHGDILLPVPGSCPQGLLTPSFAAAFLVKFL